MDESKPLPVVPVVSAGSSVSASVEAAKVMSARAVVELRDGSLLLYSLAALAGWIDQGRGAAPLNALDAITIGRPSKGPPPLRLQERLHIALSFTFDFVVKDFDPANPRWMVATRYRCPVDNEPYSGPGKCDLHDVELVEASTI